MSEKKEFTEVDGLKLRPWSHGQLLKLSPILEEIVSLIEEEKMTLDEIISSAQDTKKLRHLIFKFLPFLCPLVAVTLSLDPKDVEDWPFDKVCRVGLTILIQNTVKIREIVSLGNMTLKNFMN